MTKTEQENTQNDIAYLSNKITGLEDKIGNIIEEQHKATDTAKKIHTIKQQIIQNRLTCAIVFFTVVTILVNILMWHQMTKQTNANEIQANASIEAINLAKDNSISSDTFSHKSLAIAESSIVLTRISNERAENIAQIDLRPYVVIDTGIIINALSVGQPIGITIYYRNIGKTPAFDFFHANTCIPVDIHSIDSMENVILQNIIAVTQKHLNENVSVGTNITMPKDGIYGILAERDFIEISRGTKKLVFIGVMSYSDIFKKRHRTWYCLEMDNNRDMFVYNSKYCGMY